MPARMREDEGSIARAAGQLPLASSGCCAKLEAVRRRNREAGMLRVIRIILVTLSMYIVTHLFVFAALPLAILVSYVDKDRIPALK